MFVRKKSLRFFDMSENGHNFFSRSMAATFKSGTDPMKMLSGHLVE